MVGRAMSPMIDDTMMMRPKRCLTISRAASRASRNPAVRSVSMTDCHSSSLVSSSGLRMMVPALLTRMSMRSSPAMDLFTAAASATSKGRMRATVPASRSVAARDSSVAGSRPLRTSSAPAPASAWAIAQPRPREAPVTSAIFPATLKSGPVAIIRPPDPLRSRVPRRSPPRSSSRSPHRRARSTETRRRARGRARRGAAAPW